MSEIKKKRPQVKANCIGCGACTAITPDVFEFNAEGYVKAKRLDSYEGLGVEDSISACPVDAIVWIEENN
ncbi:MAG: ferredoxin [Candidatus Gracilibacteria bacterium]|nr:ferredoxin [Candidatus Gracilibacteria bacterium]MDD2908557.1 ferredoxin [Candidatus Gracilibacteria bacterium]